MDPLARLIGHGGTLGLVGELAGVGAVLALLGFMWWRDRRRTADSRRPAARMRDDDETG